MSSATETIWDVNVQETEEAEEREQDNISYEIMYYPADITLKGYLDKYNAGQLIDPEFQRQYVWDQVRASKLIESFLLGLPVPSVFLYKQRETKYLEIVDGRQRIMTAIKFFKGDFDGKPFQLKNVKDKWNGRKFDELYESDQIQLQDSVMRATIIQQLTPDDNSSIYQVFERLNTGGVNLTPMEIRKCVYSGALVDMLDELNTDKNWRRLIGKEEPDKRMRDVEWVLRVLAFYEHGNQYKKPMKSFLNQYLIEGNKLSPNDLTARIKKTKQIFSRTCRLIYEELGEKPFQVMKGRFNYAVLDSVFCTSMLALDNKTTGFKTRFESLKRDDVFIENVTTSTSDLSAVTKRFEKAREYLLSD